MDSIIAQSESTYSLALFMMNNSNHFIQVLVAWSFLYVYFQRMGKLLIVLVVSSPRELSQYLPSDEGIRKSPVKLVLK